MKVVDLHQQLNFTLEMVKNDIIDKKISIKFLPFAQNYMMMADPSRLQQVLWNIIKNSIKFSPENSEIEIKTENNNLNNVCVLVKDHGIGFYFFLFFYFFYFL